MQWIFETFSFLGKKGALFIISMVPLIELRGSIPFGAAMGMNPFVVYFISVVGNLLPIPFILFFGEKFFNFLKSTKLLGNFCRKYESRLMKKSDKVMKYSFWGLALFVAIPLPGTGGWSGALLAVLLNMKFKHAFLSITIGVLIAGLVMTMISYGISGIISLF